jgi:hypothetical protein
MAEIRAQITDTLTPALERATPAILARAFQMVEREGLRLSGKVQRYLKEAGIYDTGELRRSVHERTAGGADWVAATVATNVDYAAAVHEGRKPGTWAPVAPLREWVARRVRQGRITLKTPRGARRRKGAKLSRKDREIQSIAYAIQHRIHAVGIRPRPFMDLIQRQEEPGIRRRAERALARIIREEVQGE